MTMWKPINGDTPAQSNGKEVLITNGYEVRLGVVYHDADGVLNIVRRATGQTEEKEFDSGYWSEAPTNTTELFMDYFRAHMLGKE
jgi:hypothetical protein